MKLWLIAESGQQRFAIESSVVNAVLPAVELPATDPASGRRGQITYRDRSIEVLDLEVLLHGRPTTAWLGNRIIVVDDGAAGLLAERVLDTLEAESLPLTEDTGWPAEFISGTVPDGDERLPCLSLPRVLAADARRSVPGVVVAPPPPDQPGEACWSAIGVFGNGQCPELQTHLHCRNCPVMVKAGRSVFQRPTPPGYLAELAAKRSQDERGSQNEIQTFIFASGGRWFGIESDFVERVLAPQSIHRLPFRSNDILLGAANISGELLLAFSLGPVFGRPESPFAAPGDRLAMARMVVVRSQSSEFILLVDDVLGIEDFPASRLENEMPADLPVAANPFVIGMVRIGQIQPILLNVELLLKQLAKEMHGTGRQSKKETSVATDTWRFENRLPELQRLAAALEQFGDAHDLAPGLVAQLNVGLDELFTNAVNYGYESVAEDEIRLGVRLAEGVLQFELSTGGRPFDPFSEAPAPDLDSDLEARRVGGLGVHLARQMFDEYSYAWREERNIITLRKRVASRSKP